MPRCRWTVRWTFWRGAADNLVCRPGPPSSGMVEWSQWQPPESADTERTAAEDTAHAHLHLGGTTGKPKGAVHTHCGFPVKAAQDMAFGPDLHAGDVIYWMTDMGWMMGPWLVFGALLLGATPVCTMAPPIIPTPTGCGRSSPNTASPSWDLAHPHSRPHPLRRRTSSTPTTSPRSPASPRPANRGIPIPGCGCSTWSARQAAHHQLQRRHRNQRRHRDGQLPSAAETRLLFRRLPRHGRRCGR